VIISKRIDWIFANTYIKKDITFTQGSSNFLHAVVIVFYGAIKIIQLYFLQAKHKPLSARIPNHLVVESQTHHMHLNYFRYFNPKKNKENYLKIECFNKYQYTGIAKVSLLEIYKEFYLTAKEIIPIMRQLKETLNRQGLMKEVATSLPVFSYFVCLFKILKKRNDNLQLYSGGAPLISSAAIFSGIETYYLAHGFINKPFERDVIDPSSKDYFLAYPDYRCIYTYSEEEKQSLKVFEIGSEICIYPYKKLTDLKKKIIIFLNYSDSNMNQENLEMLISMFQKNNYEVIIKIHPSYLGSFDRKLAGNSSIRFEDSPGLSADSFIQKELPQFACGWISTTLCEALNLGVIPICLSDESDPLFHEILYPLKKKSIMWLTEKKLINDYLKDNSYGVDSIIKKLD
tara:strand:- start:601 stop:1803 length:1203 start_codon:yes stop_codon:yes gene_type:complete